MSNKINNNKILTEILYNKLETLDVPKDQDSYEFTHDEYIFLVNFVDELLTETFKIKPETIINNLNKNYIKNIINNIKSIQPKTNVDGLEAKEYKINTN